MMVSKTYLQYQTKTGFFNFLNEQESRLDRNDMQAILAALEFDEQRNPIRHRWKDITWRIFLSLSVLERLGVMCCLLHLITIHCLCTPKSRVEWFNDVPDDIRRKLMANTPPAIQFLICLDLKEALLDAFDFHVSPEGKDYWDSTYRQLTIPSILP